MIETIAFRESANEKAAGIARRILVGLDGEPSSDAALLSASQLAPASRLHVLAVTAPHRQSEFDQRERVEAQIERVLGSEAGIRVDVRAGSVPTAVAAFAEALDASLLVTGLGEPCVRDRLLSAETAFHIARWATMPLLSVSQRGGTPPVRVMVAMDSSEASRRAALLVRDIAAPDARIILAHVRTPAAREMPRPTLAAYADRLQRGHLGRVELVELDGDPATELLWFANAHGVDLIAIGRRSNVVRPRGIMGRVATRIVRCAQSSFLMADERGAP
ncbi:MAG: universal stress protein [Gemmatimonadaceae bacterium]